MTDDTAVRDLVAAFEAATLPHDKWTHHAHLTVAAWYVLWYGPADALDRFRAGLQRLNTAHGVPQTPTRGYHETITRLYIHLVTRAATRSGMTTPLSDIVDGIVAECEDRTLPFTYYSKDRLASWEARTTWVEPDLHPLT